MRWTSKGDLRTCLTYLVGWEPLPKQVSLIDKLLRSFHSMLEDTNPLAAVLEELARHLADYATLSGFH